MDHVDAEVLALVALGEPVDAADEAHVAVCQRCGDEVAAFARVALLARDARPGDLVAPPARVWAGIASELGLAGSTPAPAVRAPAAEVPAAAAPATEAPGSPEAPGSAQESTRSAQEAPGSAQVVPLRRRPAAWIATAAAAGVVVGGLGGAWVVAERNAPDPAPVLAVADLEALPGWNAAGHAEVEEADDGTRVLVLSVDVAEVDGLREVWLLKEDVSGLVSLGLLDGEEGRFVLPAGLDLAEYPVVDVSREPIDGDPAHSGDSIVRGVLDDGALDA